MENGSLKSGRMKFISMKFVTICCSEVFSSLSFLLPLPFPNWTMVCILMKFVLELIQYFENKISVACLKTINLNLHINI